MKITYAKAKQTMQFCELNPGDVFAACLGGVPHMKLKATSKDDDNAVNLIVNCTCKVKENSQIIPIDCELVVK